MKKTHSLFFQNQSKDLSNTLNPEEFSKIKTAQILHIPENDTVMTNTIDYPISNTNYFLGSEHRYGLNSKNKAKNHNLMNSEGIINYNDNKSKSLEINRRVMSVENPDQYNNNKEKIYLDQFMRESLKFHVKEHINRQPQNEA